MTSRISIWANTYKQPGSSQPDGRGSCEISTALVQELAAAMQAGQGMIQNAQGQWVFKLRLSAWRADGSNPNAPVMTGQIAGLAETQQIDAQAAANRAARNGQQAPAGGVWPGAAPAAAPAPQPAAAPAGAPPAPVWNPQTQQWVTPAAAPAPAAPAPQAPPVAAPVAPPVAPAAPPAAPANGGWSAPAGF
jgi:hypothetical protein